MIGEPGGRLLEWWVIRREMAWKGSLGHKIHGQPVPKNVYTCASFCKVNLTGKQQRRGHFNQIASKFVGNPFPMSLDESCLAGKSYLYI